MSGRPFPTWARSALVLLLTAFLVGGPNAHADDRLPVAVSYFDNTSKDAKLEPLKKGLAEMLITDLSISRDIRLVERERLNDVLKEVALQKSPYMDEASAVKLGKGLGAAYILTGSYIVAGQTMRVDCRVVDVETSAVVVAVKAEGPSSDFLAIERTLATQLLQALSGSVGLVQKKRVGAGGTGNLDALTAFSDGLDAMDSGDALLAAKALKKALAADPEFKAAQKLKSRVDAMSAAYDLNLYKAQVQRVGRYLAGKKCACSYTQPMAEVSSSSDGARLAHRLWGRAGGGRLDTKVGWTESVRLAVDLTALGKFEEAEEYLDLFDTQDFIQAGNPAHRPNAGTAADHGRKHSLAAQCVAYQVRSYTHLVQLELDEAMAWQAKAAAMPDHAFKSACLSAIQLQVVGVNLDRPLKGLIQDTIDDPALFAKRKDQLRVIEKISPQAWGQVKQIVDDPPACEQLCPWVKK